MNCSQCQTEFTPGSHAAHQKYCSTTCKQIVRSDKQKKARREKHDCKGMSEEAFKDFRQSRRPDRPIKETPQRMRIQRLDMPPIPIEYAFLYPKKLRFAAYGATEGQEKLRAEAVRTMVAMAE